MNSTVQLRVDAKTKRGVANIFKSLGMDMSSGVKVYFEQVLRTKSIPFPLLTENGYTPEQEEKILAESRQTMIDYKNGKLKGYSSVAEIKKDILSR